MAKSPKNGHSNKEHNGDWADVIGLLKDQFGISIEAVDHAPSREDLSKHGYYKLPDEVAQFLMPFQQFPGMISNEYACRLLDGAFHIHIPAGASLVQKKNGAYITNYRMGSNLFAGQGDAIPINTATASAAFAAHNIFSLASIATGQYYLDQIDKKLDGVKNSVNNIQEFLDNDKFTELLADSSTLTMMQEDLSTIQLDPIRSTAALTNVLAIKNRFLKEINFYKLETDSDLSKMKQKDSEEVFMSKRESAIRSLVRLHFAIQAYQYSYLIELLISPTADKADLDKAADRLSEHVESYRETFSLFTKKTEEYIKNVKGLKPNPFPYFAKGSIKPAFSAVMALVLRDPGALLQSVSGISDAVDAYYEYSKADEKKRKEQLQYIRETLNHSLLPDSLQVIPESLRTMSCPQELLKTEDGLYYKAAQAE